MMNFSVRKRPLIQPDRGGWWTTSFGSLFSVSPFRIIQMKIQKGLTKTSKEFVSNSIPKKGVKRKNATTHTNAQLARDPVMGRLPVSKMAIPRTCERMQPGNRSKATNQNPQVPTLTNSRAETKTNPHQIIPFEQGRIEKELKSLGSSPIKLDILEECLHHYPSKDAVLLYEGFKYGFKIPFKGQRGYSYSSNHGSALNNPDIISKKLMNEVELGRVAGPYDYLPLEHLKISPIGLVPKSTPGDFRLIFDLSFPRGSSINAGIDQEDSSVIYTNFDEVKKMVLKEGKGSYLIKTDIKSAFRLLPINPSDFELLGMKFQGKYYSHRAGKH